jgi:hypothetical protein
MTRTRFLPHLIVLAIIGIIAAWLNEVDQLHPFSVALKGLSQDDLNETGDSAKSPLNGADAIDDNDPKAIFINTTNIIAWLPLQPDEAIEASIQEQITLNESISTFHPLSNCSATCQVKIVGSNDKFWTLYTYDCRGVQKTIGGDEFYVTYHDQTPIRHGSLPYATAAAIILDQHDGSYRLFFVSTPLKPPPDTPTPNREIRVQFPYTCGIGSIPVPLKEPWQGSGFFKGSHAAIIDQVPPIRPFQPPVTSIDLSQYERIVSFGDSLMRDMVRHMQDHTPNAPPNYPYYKPNTKWYYKPEVSTSIQNLPILIGKLTEWHDQDLSTNLKTALILGSAAWDLSDEQPDEHQGRSFDNHVSACRSIIAHVRTRYPSVTILWKLPTALHVHLAQAPWCLRMIQCRNRYKYLSHSRMEHLRRIQLELMRELSIQVMDVYETYWLSADQHWDGDGVHYNTNMSQFVLDFFYKNNATETQ